MSDDDDPDFDERPTPGQRRASTESERQRHARRYLRGVPVVRPEPADEVKAPLELLLNGQLDVDDYAQIEALRRSADDVYVLLMNLAKAMSRHRDNDRSGNREIEGKVLAAIEEQAKQFATLSERVEELELLPARVTPIETTIASVKGYGWKAALAIVTTLLGSAAAIIATLQSKAEKQGAADERSLNHGSRIDRLERLYDERPSPVAPRRRGIDYDIAPAIVPSRHGKQDQEP